MKGSYDETQTCIRLIIGLKRYYHSELLKEGEGCFLLSLLRRTAGRVGLLDGCRSIYICLAMKMMMCRIHSSVPGVGTVQCPWPVSYYNKKTDKNDSNNDNHIDNGNKKDDCH